MRTISSVQTQFREGDRDGDGIADYARSLEELSHAGLIDNVLGGGTKSGYRFGLRGGVDAWQASATPASTSTGTRNFLICTDGIVRFSGNGPATCSSPAIQ